MHRPQQGQPMHLPTHAKARRDGRALVGVHHFPANRFAGGRCAGAASSVRGIRGAVAFPLGCLDLTLVKLDGCHAREDVQKERESAC
jgi:hypothetical protein